MVLLVMFTFILNSTAALGTNIWLSRWADRSKKETLSSNSTTKPISKTHGLTVYTILGCSQGNKI